MNNMNNILGGFVVFVTLITLILNIYVGVYTSYNLSESYDIENKNIFEALQELQILKEINDLSAQMQKVASPGNTIDLLGGLLFAGIGIIKVIVSSLIFPVLIFSIITTYYSIPGVITSSIVILFSLSLGFILLKYYTRT